MDSGSHEAAHASHYWALFIFAFVVVVIAAEIDVAKRHTREPVQGLVTRC